MPRIQANDGVRIVTLESAECAEGVRESDERPRESRRGLGQADRVDTEHWHS
jgi:hypothetical protein